MKKLILTTSALTLVAGAAVADIDLSAEAIAKYGNWDGNAAGFSFSTELTAALEETTSSGISYGGEITIDATGGSVSDGTIWINTPNAGKFSFGVDAFDAVTDVEGDDSGDIQWEYSNGGFDVTLTVEGALGNELADDDPAVDSDSDGNLTNDVDATTNDWDLQVGFDAGGMDIGVGADSTGAWDVSVGTEISGIDATVTYDSAGVAGLELAGEAGGLGWELAYATDDTYSVGLNGEAGAIEWSIGADESGNVDASVSGSMGDTSWSLAYDSANAGGVGDDAEVVVEVTHSLDMLTMGVKANDAGEYEISATAGFSF